MSHEVDTAEMRRFAREELPGWARAEFVAAADEIDHLRSQNDAHLVGLDRTLERVRVLRSALATVAGLSNRLPYTDWILARSAEARVMKLERDRRGQQRRAQRERRRRLPCCGTFEPQRHQLHACSTTSGRSALPSEARRWRHTVKGPIVGVEVGGDETWMKVRLIGDHRLTWLSPGRGQRGEVTPDGEVMTLRRDRMIEGGV